MELKNIIEGPELVLTLNNATLGEITFSALKNHGDQILQIDAETNEILPASLLLNRTIRLARWLQEKNIGVGDLVSINSENRLEFCIVPLTTFFIGAVLAPFNPDYTAGELRHVLNLTKPRIVFCSPKTIDTMVSILFEHPYIEYLVVFGENRIITTEPKVVFFNDIMQGVGTQTIDSQDFVVRRVNPQESVAVVLCSSGTTGLPKGVMLTHSNFTCFLDVARTVISELISNTDSNESPIVGLVPFFHAFGFFTMYTALLKGISMVVMPKFNPKLFLEVLEKHKITRLQVPPPIILFLIKNPMVKKYDLSSLKEILCGAAPLSKNSEKMILKKFQSVDSIRQAYGMTELTLSVTMNVPGKIKSGSVGQLVPGMKCKVINEKGEALGPYQEGELCFKGPLVMKGYLNDEKATSETIDTNGWLHTGDVGYYDNEGYFFIVDRIKELIKYKGFQIAPAELEALLVKHRDVRDAAVVALPDEDAGEIPIAFVVRKPNSKVTEAELEKYVSGNVSRQKRIRGGVHFVNEIPRNPSGKILRRVLKEHARKIKSKL